MFEVRFVPTLSAPAPSRHQGPQTPAAACEGAPRSAAASRTPSITPVSGKSGPTSAETGTTGSDQPHTQLATDLALIKDPFPMPTSQQPATAVPACSTDQGEHAPRSSRPKPPPTLSMSPVTRWARSGQTASLGGVKERSRGRGKTTSKARCGPKPPPTHPPTCCRCRSSTATS